MRNDIVPTIHVTTPPARNFPPAPVNPLPPPLFNNSTHPRHFSTQPYREAEPCSLTAPVQRAPSPPTRATSPVRRTRPYSYAEAAHRAPPRSRVIVREKSWHDVGREQDPGITDDWQQVKRNRRFQSIPPARPNIPPETQYTYNSRNATSYTRKVGCFNCGEQNHRQASCRFDHRLRCGLCHRLGHKQRLCRTYPTSE